MPSTRSLTIGRAFLLLGCGILMTFFGCMGFLNFQSPTIEGNYATVAKLGAMVGGVMFVTGLLACVAGVLLAVVLMAIRLFSD